MKHLKKFDDYNFLPQEISESGMSTEIFGGWDKDTIDTMEQTIANLYNKINVGASKIKTKVSNLFSSDDNKLDNETKYITYLDENFTHINWKDVKTAKYYIDTAKNALLGDRNPEVIRKICSTIYHLINR